MDTRKNLNRKRKINRNMYKIFTIALEDFSSDETKSESNKRKARIGTQLKNFKRARS